MSDIFTDGLTFFQQRKFAEAEACFTQALSAHPANPNYLYYRASARMEQAKSEEAVSDLSQALEGAELLPIRYTRGELYLTMGELDKAVEDFSVVLSDTTDAGRYWRSLAYLGRGLIALDTGDVESAILDLSEAEDLAKAEGDTALLARISAELERSGF